MLPALLSQRLRIILFHQLNLASNILSSTLAKRLSLNRGVVSSHPQRISSFQREHQQRRHKQNSHVYVWPYYRLPRSQPLQSSSSYSCFSRNNQSKCKMGSMNCKEYATTQDNGSCTNEAGNGTVGSYLSTSETKMTEYTEPVIICNEADINDNEMKQFDFNEDTKILLIKQRGQLNAIGNKCPHYGAPLNAGALGDGRVRCPWHGACFNVETGDIEDFPGLDSIPCYRVEVGEDGEVQVSAKRKDLQSSKRIKDMVKRDIQSQRVFVVVGGGPAGGVCVETLRQEGFNGRIIMICKEKYLPYDRVKISKSMDVAIETIQFRHMEFYTEYGIEVKLGVEATKLDTASKIVHCSDGESIEFDKVFIATGCRPLKPSINGADLGNVVTIREYADGKEIIGKINKESHVVCLGSSFISLEAASFLASKVKSVTVVGRDNVPLKAVFGEKVGERILKLFRDNGVIMLMKNGIENIIGNNVGNVVEVQLKDGSKIPCDLLIMGTGSRFNTEFLTESGILNLNYSVDTDMYLMTKIPDIYVGGDIANAPVYSIGNQQATIGHYQLAQYHGRIAAINMAGFREKELHAIPFFFTMLFGKGLRYAGYGSYFDVVITGDLANMKFVAYFLNEHDTVIATASCGRDPIVAQFAELQSQGLRLHRTDIVAEEPESWVKMLYDYPRKRC